MISVVNPLSAAIKPDCGTVGGIDPILALIARPSDQVVSVPGGTRGPDKGPQGCFMKSLLGHTSDWFISMPVYCNKNKCIE